MFGMIIAWHLCLPSTMAQLLTRSPVRCLTMKIATQKRKNHQERADSTCKMWGFNQQKWGLQCQHTWIRVTSGGFESAKNERFVSEQKWTNPQCHCNIFRKMLTDRHLGHLAKMVRSLQKGSPKEPEIW